ALHGGGEGALDPGVQAQQAVPQFDVLGRGHGAGLRHGTPSGNDGRWNVRPRTGLTRVYMYMHAYLRQQEVAYTYKYCEECPVPWIYLLVASVFEVVFALATNATEGFTKLGPSLLTAAAAAGGIFFLSLALRSLDVGVGYTVWTGIGSVGTVAFGTVV